LSEKENDKLAELTNWPMVALFCSTS